MRASSWARNASPSRAMASATSRSIAACGRVGGGMDGLLVSSHLPSHLKPVVIPSAANSLGAGERIGALCAEAKRIGQAPMSHPESMRASMGGRPEGPGIAKTVMIVEDNELNMKLFHDLLDSQGYRTLKTRSGLDALELARRHRPDLILMDIQLPEVSGLEVTKWLKDEEGLSDIP